MRRVAALIFCCLPAMAFADCTAQLASWARALHPELTFDKEGSVCKASPVDPAVTLGALLFKEQEEQDVTTYGLEVLTARGAKVERHLYQSEAIVSDAVRFEGLSLDTARYQLAPGNRAFGVRVRYSGSSRVNPYESTWLNLYVEDGQVLRRVLDKLVVHQNRGEWDGNCAGEFEGIERTVAIGKQGSTALAPLEVSSRSVTTRNTQAADGCKDTAGPPQTSKVTLPYDGTRFEVPEAMRGF